MATQRRAYNLSVTFDVSVDLNTALVMVQNRVTLAMPLLPTPVQQQGITIRKKTPDIMCMVNFISPDGRFDDIFISNYALINIKDELLRVDGVSDISIMGERDYSIRIWLDPQKLAARNMTAIDVANAVRDQNQESASGQLGQPPAKGTTAFQLPIDMLGRLNQPEQFRDIVVKVGKNSPGLGNSAMVSPSSGSTAGTTLSPGGLSGSLASDISASSGAMTGTMTDPSTTSGAASGGTTSGGTTSGGTASGGATDAGDSASRARDAECEVQSLRSNRQEGK